MPVRIPALQCSLLFSSEIDTSGSCNTIVTDKWIEYRIHEVSFDEKIFFSKILKFLKFFSQKWPVYQNFRIWQTGVISGSYYYRGYFWSNIPGPFYGPLDYFGYFMIFITLTFITGFLLVGLCHYKMPSGDVITNIRIIFKRNEESHEKRGCVRLEIIKMTNKLNTNGVWFSVFLV